MGQLACGGWTGKTARKACAWLTALVLTGPLAVQGADAEPAPPEGQTYIGAKRCASCHFEPFLSWKKTAHANAFEVLTAKYQKDEKCLKCHTTAFGEPTGYKQGELVLAGVTCETCHGPGSRHEEVAQPFTTVKNLPPEQEKRVRDSIWRFPPKNVCIDCHIVQGHKPSETPPELRP
jgi:hypothetical protein